VKIVTLPIDTNTAVAASKGAAVLNHVKNNNVSYLLGVLIGHMLGITEMVLQYGQGMC